MIVTTTTRINFSDYMEGVAFRTMCLDHLHVMFPTIEQERGCHYILTDNESIVEAANLIATFQAENIVEAAKFENRA